MLVGCCSMLVVCCLLFVACCLLSFVHSLLFDVLAFGGLVLVDCFRLAVGLCVLFGVWC